MPTERIDWILWGARGLDLALSLMVAAAFLAWALGRGRDRLGDAFTLVVAGSALCLVGVLASSASVGETLYGVYLRQTYVTHLYGAGELQRVVVAWIARGVGDLALAACLVGAARRLIRSGSARV